MDERSSRGHTGHRASVSIAISRSRVERQEIKVTHIYLEEKRLAGINDNVAMVTFGTLLDWSTRNAPTIYSVKSFRHESRLKIYTESHFLYETM